MDSSTDSSDVDESSGESSTTSDESQSARPNRFIGPKSTWREFTEEERALHASMTQMRDQDLSLHLYNAHAMKRDHYDADSASKLKPWSSKDWWRNKRSADEAEDGKPFVPTKSWTAWPLSSDLVPRVGEHIGPKDESDLFTFKKREVQWPSRELEDILTGITLRDAKEKFEGREWEYSREFKGISQEAGLRAQDREVDGPGEVCAPELHLELRTVDAEDGREISIEGAAGYPDLVRQSPDSMNKDSQDNLNPMDHDCHKKPEDNRALEDSVEAFVWSHNVPIILRPIVSADDAKSRELLRPTIRHTLTRLDDLLMALHEARQTCLHYASERTDSQTEGGAGYESLLDDPGHNPRPRPPSSNAATLPPLQPAKRPGRGRPLKNVDFRVMSELSSHKLHKKISRGRKRKLHEPLQGESEAEMLLRIARLQKKSIPFPSSEAPRSASSSPTEATRDGSKKRGNSAHAREKRSARLGLRDWSEVLGTAALIGFPRGVIARTAQRCADLFSEGITLQSLVENPIAGGDEDRIVHYLPDQIPDLTSTSHESSVDEESDSFQPPGRHKKHGRRWRKRKHSKKHSKTDGGLSDSEEVETTNAGTDSFYCPYQNCIRHEEPFTFKGYLLRHLKNVHKREGGKLEEALEGSNEEMEGGVHVDGFLKEIERRRGWRAADVKQRQRSKGRYVKRGERANEIEGVMTVESDREGKEDVVLVAS